jgi:hypothetical protein
MEYHVDTRGVGILRGQNRRSSYTDPEPTIMAKKGGNAHPSVGNKYDPAFFHLMLDGETYDHFDNSFVAISENPGAGETEGYTADYQWLSRKCHNRFITEDVSHSGKSPES